MRVLHEIGHVGDLRQKITPSRHPNALTSVGLPVFSRPTVYRVPRACPHPSALGDGVVAGQPGHPTNKKRNRLR